MSELEKCNEKLCNLFNYDLLDDINNVPINKLAYIESLLDNLQKISSDIRFLYYEKLKKETKALSSENIPDLWNDYLLLGKINLSEYNLLLEIWEDLEYPKDFRIYTIDIFLSIIKNKNLSFNEIKNLYYQKLNYFQKLHSDAQCKKLLNYV